MKNSSTLSLLLELCERGAISFKELDRIDKKANRLAANAVKAAAQTSTNHFVLEHLESLEPGILFKHRAVWEAVGRDEHTRDQVLKSLQFFKERGVVEQIRKGPNNFQVFWAVTQKVEVENGE